jgi:hypothetical protein
MTQSTATVRAGSISQITFITDVTNLNLSTAAVLGLFIIHFRVSGRLLGHYLEISTSRIIHLRYITILSAMLSLFTSLQHPVQLSVYVSPD